MRMAPFVPRSGVHVETDPKATTARRASAMGDDEGVIDEYVKKLEARLQPRSSNASSLQLYEE